MVCQRPKRASFISTPSRIEAKKFAKGVNALNGLLSFLLGLLNALANIIGLCQRPKRASFISTETAEKDTRSEHEWVSTP